MYYPWWDFSKLLCGFLYRVASFVTFFPFVFIFCASLILQKALINKLFVSINFSFLSFNIYCFCCHELNQCLMAILFLCAFFSFIQKFVFVCWCRRPCVCFFKVVGLKRFCACHVVAVLSWHCILYIRQQYCQLLFYAEQLCKKLSHGHKLVCLPSHFCTDAPHVCGYFSRTRMWHFGRDYGSLHCEIDISPTQPSAPHGVFFSNLHNWARFKWTTCFA